MFYSTGPGVIIGIGWYSSKSHGNTIKWFSFAVVLIINFCASFFSPAELPVAYNTKALRSLIMLLELSVSDATI